MSALMSHLTRERLILTASIAKERATYGRKTWKRRTSAGTSGQVTNPSTVISQENAVTPIGITDDSRAVAVMRYSAFPNWERYIKPEHPTYDKLYELKVDEDGELVHVPYTSDGYIRAAKWQIRSLAPHRGDYSRVEFFELGLQKEIL